jgi:hypothetical protein
MTNARLPTQGRITYIHIGLPKTGTTSLQAFFHVNREALRTRGVVYPRTAGSYGGNGTPSAFALLGETPAYFRASNPNYASPQLDFEACWGELIDQAEAEKALLVSSEEFAFVPPSELRQRSAFDARAKSILVYLRRQDEAIEASYLQQVLAGLYRGTIDDYLDDVLVNRNPDQGPFDYRTLISECWEAFGRANVHVYTFQKRRGFDWIFATALDAIGLRLDSKFKLPKPRNPSLHPLFVEYLRRRLIAGTWHSGLVNNMRALSREPAFTEGVPRRLLSHDLRERVLDHFNEDNRWLASQLPGDVPQLFIDDGSHPEQFVAEQYGERFEILEQAAAEV